jgi:hypothetical protein
MNLIEEILDDQVKVKLSICNKCNGVVRSAIEHKMTVKTKHAFAKEVLEYNLTVKTQLLTDFKKENPKWCECED